MTTQPLTQTEILTSFDLVMPPDPELLRVVRLVASGVASLTTLGIDAVEGFRVAADELVATLIQASDGGPVTVTFELGSALLTIRGRARLDPEVGFALDPLTDRILDTVVTSHDWQTDDNVLTGRIALAIVPV
jgi:hypothetical protein